MSSYKIAVIIPSRGTMYADTLKEILENLEGFDYDIFWSHGKPIPDCFNKPIEKALEKKWTHFWLVEEDMVIPPQTLQKLLEADVDVIACNYPVLDGTPSVHADIEGNAYFTGTGCMLVKDAVFRKHKKPIFRSDIGWLIRSQGKNLKLSAQEFDPTEVYGYHDVTFGISRYLSKKPIVVADVVCYQRKLKKKGEKDTNQGQDTIELIKDLGTLYFDTEEQEKKENVLMEVLYDGKVMFMQKEHAKRLIKEKKAKLLTKSYKYLTVEFFHNPELMDQI